MYIYACVSVHVNIYRYLNKCIHVHLHIHSYDSYRYFNEILSFYLSFLYPACNHCDVGICLYIRTCRYHRVFSVMLVQVLVNVIKIQA
jgi:hypothetical protein